MSARASRRGFSDSRGQTLVEFSLSVLMLVLVMLGVFEMSRLLFLYTTVSDAARAGVRYAIVHGEDDAATTAQVQTLVKGYLSAGPMNLANATVTVTGAGAAKGSTAIVSVVYPYDPFVLFYSKFFSISLSSVSQGVIVW